MTGDVLVLNAQLVVTRSDFLKFLAAAVENLQAQPTEWENDSLESFLKALGGFLHDVPGYYKNTNRGETNLEALNWRLLAEMILAAKVYE